MLWTLMRRSWWNSRRCTRALRHWPQALVEARMLKSRLIHRRIHPIVQASRALCPWTSSGLSWRPYCQLSCFCRNWTDFLLFPSVGLLCLHSLYIFWHHRFCSYFMLFVLISNYLSFFWSGQSIVLVAFFLVSFGRHSRIFSISHSYLSVSSCTLRRCIALNFPLPFVSYLRRRTYSPSVTYCYNLFNIMMPSLMLITWFLSVVDITTLTFDSLSKPKVIPYTCPSLAPDWLDR